MKIKLSRRGLITGAILGIAALIIPKIWQKSKSPASALANERERPNFDDENLIFFTPDEYILIYDLAEQIIPSEGEDAPGASDIMLANKIDRFIADNLEQDVQNDIRNFLETFAAGSDALRGQGFSDLTPEEQREYILFWKNFPSLSLSSPKTPYHRRILFHKRIVGLYRLRRAIKCLRRSLQGEGFMRLSADVVIVGSGPGGAVMAKELSEIAGLSIILVDAGPYVLERYYQQLELKMTELFWERGNRVTDDLSTQILQARCVGGGTVVYTGTAHKVPDFVLNDWAGRWRVEGFTRGDLDAGYERVASNMFITEHTEEDWNDNNRLFVEACTGNNIGVENLKRFVDKCIGCGFCYQGCKYRRKVTMLNTYLPKAFANGVQLISNFHVNEVLYDPKTKRASGVKGVVKPTPPLAERNSVPEGSLEINARLVVMAAGAINTPSILLRSKSLPDLGAALGRFVLMQNAHNVHILMPYKVSMIRGIPKAASTKEFLDSHRFVIAPAQNHPIATANDVTGFGLNWKHLMRYFHNLLQWQVICGDDPHYTCHCRRL